MKTILPIVEGDGDIKAVPALIRRIAHEAGIFDIRILRPHKRGDLPKVLKRFDDYLGAALYEKSPILWVMDYDCQTCDSVEQDIGRLKQMAIAKAPSALVEFTFMVKEFESLFICDKETLIECFPDIPNDLSWPQDPESIRGAKEWISKARPKGLAYKETVHQEKLATQVNLGRLRARSPSYIRFESAVLKLLS